MVSIGPLGPPPKTEALKRATTCQNDKTRVAPVIVPKSDNSTHHLKIKDRSYTDSTNWRRNYSDYKPSNQKKWNKVYKQIYNNKNLANKDDARNIANMVCSLSDKYGLDPEITVSILESESQFQFIPKVMQHGTSKYKGVMQVDYDTIKSMYYNQSQAKNTKLNQHERALAYDHWRFKNDQTRIDELKKQYSSPQALYQAIQQDVSLGIEVGIMAYKAKLTAAKGNADKALAEYCGNQYKLPSDSTAQRYYAVIPKYNGTA